MSTTTVETVSPTDPYQLPNGLTLHPRIHLRITLHRVSTVVPTVDDWKLKRSLIDFLKSSFSITVADDDVIIRRYKDLNKRPSHHPVARGSVFVRDLGFLKASSRGFDEWRKVIVDQFDGVEVNLEGVRLKVGVSIPDSDDCEGFKKGWDEFFAFGSNRGYSRSGRQEPDTIILRGLPSRWFAEPRVSSKPSMLVTHTIFSTFGKIRNLNVAEDNDFGKDADEDDGDKDIVSGLHCKVVVQFEKYRDFQNAMKVLCSRSLHKEGSRMKADYEVTWDKDGYFNSVKRRIQDRTDRGSALEATRYRDESRRPTYSSRYSPDDDVRPKRFKERVG